jgi:hypothetical protein
VSLAGSGDARAPMYALCRSPDKRHHPQQQDQQLPAAAVLQPQISLDVVAP